MKITTNLGLKKPEGTDVVNIDDFNYNADIIDTELQKRALKADIPAIPVQSVNGKTGVVTLTAVDVGAATSAQGIKADTALQSSKLGQAGGPAKQDDLASHLADNMYQTAGGSATAITLTISGTLTTGYPITFIASANNNGASTTINGKPLYKPNTTTAPTLKAGKAYTVWYNLTGNCFFIKASAEGNTIASHVLAGETFSNDSDVGLVGTMPDYSGGDVIANNISGTSPGWIHLRPPQGYYGNGHSVYWNDANFIASNIRNGVPLLGLTGTLIEGKREASGTVTSSASGSAGTFEFAGGTGQPSYATVTVTGLTFKPSVIILKRYGTYTYLTLYEEIGGDMYPKTIKMASFGVAENTVGSTHLKGDRVSASVTNGGFVLPVLWENQTYTWLAKE